VGEFAKLFNISTMTLGFAASQRRKNEGAMKDGPIIIVLELAQ